MHFMSALFYILQRFNFVIFIVCIFNSLPSQK